MTTQLLSLNCINKATLMRTKKAIREKNHQLSLIINESHFQDYQISSLSATCKKTPDSCDTRVTTASSSSGEDSYHSKHRHFFNRETLNTSVISINQQMKYLTPAAQDNSDHQITMQRRKTAQLNSSARKAIRSSSMVMVI